MRPREGSALCHSRLKPRPTQTNTAPNSVSTIPLLHGGPTQSPSLHLLCPVQPAGPRHNRVKEGRRTPKSSPTPTPACDEPQWLQGGLCVKPQEEVGAPAPSGHRSRTLTQELVSSTLVHEVLEQILTPRATPRASQVLCHKLSRACFTEVPGGSKEPRNQGGEVTCRSRKLARGRAGAQIPRTFKLIQRLPSCERSLHCLGVPTCRATYHPFSLSAAGTRVRDSISGPGPGTGRHLSVTVFLLLLSTLPLSPLLAFLRKVWRESWPCFWLPPGTIDLIFLTEPGRSIKRG